MEDLTKQQLILLTLLLSFVTSIATGIITVSLLNEVPQEVTQTINRVVEKTIERVVPVETPGKTTEKTEIKEVTVVVQEEDLVIDSIDKNSKSIVRIARIGEAVGGFHSLGTVLSNDGIVIAPLRDFVEGGIYEGVFYDGATSTLSVLGSDTATGLVYLKATITKGAGSYVFFPAKMSKTSLRLGQTVIALGGEKAVAVATGRVSALDIDEKVVTEEGKPDVTVKTLLSIKTDIISSNEIPGTLLANLSGELVGIHTLLEKGTYLPVERIKSTVASTTAAH